MQTYKSKAQPFGNLHGNFLVILQDVVVLYVKTS